MLRSAGGARERSARFRLGLNRPHGTTREGALDPVAPPSRRVVGLAPASGQDEERDALRASPPSHEFGAARRARCGSVRRTPRAPSAGAGSMCAPSSTGTRARSDPTFDTRRAQVVRSRAPSSSQFGTQRRGCERSVAGRRRPVAEVRRVGSILPHDDPRRLMQPGRRARSPAPAEERDVRGAGRRDGVLGTGSSGRIGGS